MKKRLLIKVSLALSATLIPLGTLLAQDVPQDSRIRPEYLKMSRAERTKLEKDFRNNYPLLSQRKELVPRHSFFPDASLPVYGVSEILRAPLAAAGNDSTTIWVNLASKPEWTSTNHGDFGYYSFHPVNPISYTSLFVTTAQSPASNGVQYKDGHLYGMNSYTSYGYTTIILYDTDTQTGKTRTNYLNSSSQLNLVALETAQADDGTVYGEFYNAAGTAFEWGTVDYSTKTRTTIGPATHTYVALGITKAGQLYGIAADGNLYKINKNTGSETLVGPTGVTVTDSEDQYYAQTGEINQRDDKFYWAALDGNANGGLYEVNLQTGAATKIADSGDQLYGMYIPVPEAENGAPAKITDLAANFTGANLNGEITFTAPTKTFAGDDLTGTVSYTVKGNDEVLAQGTANAGSSVTATVQVPKSGNYNFVVTTSNEVGESPKAKIEKWVGYDVPLPVTNITAKGQDSKVTISWDAPTTGVHGGNLGALTYDVYRLTSTDTVKIASDITDTSCVDNISATTLSYYTYAVQAKSEGMESELATSAGVVVGSAIEPNWTENFDYRNDFNLFTVVDANKDGISWKFQESKLTGNCARSNYSSQNGNDDWLFTPPLHLKPGRLYDVSFKVRNASGYWLNQVEVLWGNDTTASAMKDTLLAATRPSGTYTDYKYEISVPTDGKYYIGFHDNTPEKSRYLIYVDSIVVNNGPYMTAPRAVNFLIVTPANRGKLSASVSFDVPTLSVGGDTLTKVDSIQIKRDGKLIKTLGSYSAGAIAAYMDNDVPTNGTHIYEVTPFLGEQFGQTASDTAYIGQDVPSVPENITFVDNTSDILSLWNKPTETGANGGFVDPSRVSVSFYKLVAGNSGYTIGDSVTTSEIGATRMNIPQNPEETTAEDGTSQALYQLGARANGDAGHSGFTGTDAIVIGPSIKLPFKESMQHGKLDNGFAFTEGNSQYASNKNAAGWRINTEVSSDGDGGSFVWSAYSEGSYYRKTDYVITQGDETSINMPKVAINGAAKPMLYFNLYATANDPAELKVQVQTPDGVDHDVKTFDLSATTADGWTLENVDLSAYKSQRYVIVKFRGIANGEDTYIGVDNVNIFDQKEYNLSAKGIKAPAEVTAGRTGKVDVYVENIGAHAADNYSVVLYANDNAVDTVTVAKELPVLATDTVTLKVPFAINQKDDVNVKAVVVYESDLDNSNNTTDVKVIKPRASEYTKVDDLSATGDNGGVVLTWTKPAKPAPVQVVEDFEDYVPFATELGDWTLVDGDKGLAGAFFQDITYPGQGTPFAFDAFNPNGITNLIDVVDVNPGLKPHSGSQFAGAPYVNSVSGKAIAASNWLISPELSQKKQTIKFYAFNVANKGTYGTDVYNEYFDVLYSTTNTDTTSFVKLESDVADGEKLFSEGANWKEFSVELPEGAKYFAIHHNTNATNNFLFGLDDISFEKIVPGTNDSIVAYNIYRDGELIGTVKGDAISFFDEEADNGSHVYNITVVYQATDGVQNESPFSNDASVTVVDGIDNIPVNAENRYNVYTLDGKAVMLNARSLSGLSRGVYIINDKKYIVK